jgi:hypothetical protein
MNKKTFCVKKAMAVLLILVLVVPTVNAFARDERGRDNRGGDHSGGYDRGRSDRGRPHEVVVVGHNRYHYRDGRFYRPGWFGFEFLLGRPPFGAIVTSIPIGHRTVIAGGITYYTYDNVYYTAYPNGYMVVAPPPVVYAPPVVAPPPPVQPLYTQDAVTINVPNSNGSFTPITLVRRGNGYVGPQGEYYPGNPTVDQLKALYGR